MGKGSRMSKAQAVEQATRFLGMLAWGEKEGPHWYSLGRVKFPRGQGMKFVYRPVAHGKTWREAMDRLAKMYVEATICEREP